eukprot:gene11354-11503_t
MIKVHVAGLTSGRIPHFARLTPVMKSRNAFWALQGLSLEDSPVGTPTAAAAGQASSSTLQGEGRSSAVGNSSRRSTDLPDAGTVNGTSSSVSYAAAVGLAGAAEAQVADASNLKAKPSRPKLSEPLVWIDLEMTGLDIEKDTIIEIACLVTDGSLQQVLEGPSIAVHHSEEVLRNMNDWCQEHHNKSGLVQRVRDSTVSLQQAEQQVLSFVQQHTEFQTAQLAGNSVHVDRLFLQRHMPRLLEHLHYRIVDVSTFKECCRRWKPKLARKAPRKVAAHTAMSDIKESLKELQYYKSVLFK